MRTIAFAFALVATPAFADIGIRFIEGAPKDRFTFMASPAFCASGPMAIDVNLEGSAGKLVFDVTASGAGVEVYQPLEIVSGARALLGTSNVTDGDQRLRIDLASLEPGAPFAFTIDVDDTLGAREITVSGSEIVGAEVAVQIGDQTRTATFDETATATVGWSSCDS
ncbi:MAG: aggregation factor core [Boseongicola sp.]|nr:aggregation factor core [Boseongicola sp.]